MNTRGKQLHQVYILTHMCINDFTLLINHQLTICHLKFGITWSPFLKFTIHMHQYFSTNFKHTYGYMPTATSNILVQNSYFCILLTLKVGRVRCTVVFCKSKIWSQKYRWIKNVVSIYVNAILNILWWKIRPRGNRWYVLHQYLAFSGLISSKDTRETNVQALNMYSTILIWLPAQLALFV